MLLGSPGGPRDRYLALAAAWATTLQDVGEFAANGVPRSRLNVTYLLEESVAPTPLVPEWLVDHYNYTRARIFLDKFPGSRLGDGPYIVSVRMPLSTTSRVPGDFLFQDLSSVPPSLIGPWVKEFIAQAAQENYSQPQAMDQMVLKLRTDIGVAALALPDVKKAAGEWNSILATIIVHKQEN
jgi:hypothetical protein